MLIDWYLAESFTHLMAGDTLDTIERALKNLNVKTEQFR